MLNEYILLLPAGNLGVQLGQGFPIIQNLFLIIILKTRQLGNNLLGVETYRNNYKNIEN